MLGRWDARFPDQPVRYEAGSTDHFVGDELDDMDTCGARHPGHFASQVGLADAGFALDRDCSSHSGHERGNEALQHSQLVDPAHRARS